MKFTNTNEPESIAIIGMAGRFPGARSVRELWQNLCTGQECISRFSDDELLANGVPPELFKEPNYVRARAVLADVELFDASFFGFTPREAEVTDPQHRLFLECAWEALEDAGYDPAGCAGSIGVYAGSSLNTYFLRHVLAHHGGVEHFTRGFQVDGYHLLVGNDKDYLATRVAYKLNLRGPAITVQTACSSSLVAICQACSALLACQCDLALAGGVSISFPQSRGYLYQEGAIASADGHCRPFDADAGGTVFGAGVAIVLLKRLSEALADGDHIYAVVKGVAVNNDGSDKVSFSAPSIAGQAEVIALAHALAGVTADTISYVEAHGTGTPLGDPIELAGLTQAFRATTDKQQFCALGAVKSNIGHLECAAGVAGLIKTALALEHRLIPPTLHFQQPNPKCDFANSPFYVAARLTEWKDVPLPRRAGVSSFGVGGTNAHVVLEEAPDREPSGPSRPAQLLVLSAKSETALEKATENLAAWLRANVGQASGLPPRKGEGRPEACPTFADVAFTLQTGRKAFEQRRMLVAGDANEAVELLERKDSRRVFTEARRAPNPQVVFMFPGQGAQYVNMGKQLYATELIFRERVDACAEILKPLLQADLRALLYPPTGQEESARFQLTQTSVTQPALFVIEYALARLWMSWGIQPAAMVGHSVGEYVAAVLAGVMTLDDGLALLATRARLMQSMPEGGMLSVRLPEAEVRPLLRDSLAVAVVNSPKHCVVSGPHDDLAELKRALESRGVACKPLHTSHAFHSPMMEPIVEPFTQRVRQVKLNAAQIPIVSTFTGRWMAPDEWMDPSYWARQLRHTVRFAEAVGELTKQPNFILLEVGPGQTLAQLAQQHPARPKAQLVCPSMPPIDNPDETVARLTALGRLWLAGVNVDWHGFYRHERRRRVPLPTYPFERQRHWIDRPPTGASPIPAFEQPERNGSDGNSASDGEASGLAICCVELPERFLPPGGQPFSRGAAEEIVRQQLRLMSAQLEAVARAGSIAQQSTQ
jgi:acyl transferase domain-containing protein